MATISTTLELVDRMSGRLEAIGVRVQALADRFLQLDGRISSVHAHMAAFDGQNAGVDLPSVQMAEAGEIRLPELYGPGRREIQLPELRMPEPKEIQPPEFRLPEMKMADWKMEIPEQGLPVRTLHEVFPMQAEPPAVGTGSGDEGTMGMAEAVQGRQGAIAAVSEAAGAALAALRQAMQPAEGMVIGVNFAEGLAQGMRSRISAVAAAARSLASAAAAAARAALDIHSPSRAAEEIGAYFGAGFAEGIGNSVREVSNAAGRLSGIAYRELDGQIRSGLRVFGELEQAQHAPDAGGIYMRGSDARRMRELAEREAIHRFTTAELNIEFTANNTIDSKLDLDGVVSYLEEQVAEKLALAAEGVYA